MIMPNEATAQDAVATFGDTPNMLSIALGVTITDGYNQMQLSPLQARRHHRRGRRLLDCRR